MFKIIALFLVKTRSLISLTVLTAILFTGSALTAQASRENHGLTLDRAAAATFARLALKCVAQEYPNKPSHVLNTAEDVLTPKAQHPAFYGCFDWHSAVHGHWLLVKVLKTYPDLENAGEIRAALDKNLTRANLLSEAAYLHQKSRASLERTYGWAWLLKLAEELRTWDDDDARRWAKNIAPLEDSLVERYLDFMPKQTYPIRTGVHPNTAFGLAFALDYARTVGHEQLQTLLVQRSLDYYGRDADCPGSWEPSGSDFFPLPDGSGPDAPGSAPGKIRAMVRKFPAPPG